jgi:hypothetical protein
MLKNIIFILLAGTLFFSGCSPYSPPMDNTTGFTQKDSLSTEEVFFDIPNCLTKGVLAKTGTSEDSVAWGSYGNLRSFLGVCQNMIVFSENCIKDYYNAMSDTISVSGTIKAKIKINTDSAYTNQFFLWDGNSKAIEMKFSKKGIGMQGYIILIPAIIDPSLSPSLAVKIEFNTSDAAIGKEMIFSLTGDQAPAGTVNPTRQLLTLTQKAGEITLKGITYHTMIHPLTREPAWCCVFSGKISVSANKAILNIAVAPAVYPYLTSAMFDSCGMFAVTKKWICNYQDSIIRADTSFIKAASMYASLTTGKTMDPSGLILSQNNLSANPAYVLYEDCVPYKNAATLSLLGREQIYTFIVLNQNIPLWRPIYSFFTGTANPVYFDGTQGYAGSGNTAPVGFPFTAAAAANLPFYIPSDIINLSILFSDNSLPDF